MKLFILIVSAIVFSCSINAAEYRIIYFIHGDGNYLFHDNEGNALNAAENILEQAKFVGENSRGEVFIFYQKPSAQFLFFNKDNGEFFYYHNGKEIVKESYEWGSSEYFTTEAELLKKYSGSKNINRNIFLYYGHEIPGSESKGYHSSFPDKEFNINIFAKGVRNILTSLLIEKFDLVVLSTCRNGNEKVLSLLSNCTDYLIASPGDIHLSYLNSESLIKITRYNFIPTVFIAKVFAESAFNQLSENTLTGIIINIYSLKNFQDNNDFIVARFYKQPEFGLRKGNL